MASFTFTEAQKLQNPLLEPAVFQSVIGVDELTNFGYLPFADNGGSIRLSWNKVGSYGTTDAVAVASTGAVTHSAAFFTNNTIEINTIAKQFRVSRAYASPVFASQQLIAAMHNVGEQFSVLLGASAAPTNTQITPTGVGGWSSWLESGNTISAHTTSATGNISFAKLDELRDIVRVPNVVYYMPMRTARAIRALYITAGVQPESIAAPSFGLSVMAYNGIPILRSTNCQTTLAECGHPSAPLESRVYAFSVDPNLGLMGFYNGANVLSLLGPNYVPGSVEDEYSIEYHVGLALQSPLGMGVLRGVLN